MNDLKDCFDGNVRANKLFCEKIVAFHSEYQSKFETACDMSCLIKNEMENNLDVDSGLTL